MTIQAVDLFCGVGGLTAGMRKAGVDVAAGFDIERSCKYPYEHNNGSKFFCKDVTTITGDEIRALYEPNVVRLLAGCAPCQPFSTYNHGRDTTKDKKWPLLHQFARLIEEVEPELVTMENVPDVVKHDVYDDFVASLERLGYQVAAATVRCVDYGLPQNRRRHVLLASRLGPVKLIEPTHANAHKTVRQAIGHLPTIACGEQHPKDRLHTAARLSELNQERIRASSQGGTWRDWPKELRADCHQRDSGKTFPGVYGRMSWDQPGPTMTTLCYGFGNGRFGHPEQHRAITLREAAVLQGFPRSYEFAAPDEKIEFRRIGRMIGNAVPVRLGEIIARSFLKHLRNVSPHREVVA
jgi:DNA (cytosine-5)-methyltransferase 1